MRGIKIIRIQPICHNILKYKEVGKQFFFVSSKLGVGSKIFVFQFDNIPFLVWLQGLENIKDCRNSKQSLHVPLIANVYFELYCAACFFSVIQNKRLIT